MSQAESCNINGFDSLSDTSPATSERAYGLMTSVLYNNGPTCVRHAFGKRLGWDEVGMSLGRWLSSGQPTTRSAPETRSARKKAAKYKAIGRKDPKKRGPSVPLGGTPETGPHGGKYQSRSRRQCLVDGEALTPESRRSASLQLLPTFTKT
jgi:hypothetical protein